MPPVGRLSRPSAARPEKKSGDRPRRRRLQPAGPPRPSGPPEKENGGPSNRRPPFFRKEYEAGPLKDLKRLAFMNRDLVVWKNRRVKPGVFNRLIPFDDLRRAVLPTKFNIIAVCE